jgi:glycine oxidase
MATRVTVVGGGVIGLTCAWRLAESGHEVTVVAPDPGHDGASWVAAGMLAPVTEAQFGEESLTTLLLEGARQWPQFAADLEHAAGQTIGYQTAGTLTIALDPSDRAVLADLLVHQHALGLAAQALTASQCRAMVPALSPMVGSGVDVPGDHQVDNRALLAALFAACGEHGVVFRRTRAAEILDPLSVLTTEGYRVDSDLILLAAGTGSAHIRGLETAALPEIRAVKGHIVRLATGRGMLPLTRTVRALVHGRSIYLVPRRDGSVVLGATVEERSDDAVQAGSIHQLLDDARAVIPGIDEMTLLECSAGLRPATLDNQPFIGWTARPGVAAAVGHFRNGILLAPYTAALITDLFALAAISAVPA